MNAFALVVTAKSGPELLPLGLNLFSAPQTIAIAVSGGGDSLCLLHLCHDWARAAGHDLHVFTVDHQLRTESTDEAKWVAKQCQALSLPHRTMVWKYPRPSQAAARQARHRLLAQACQQVGAEWLLLGHTLDDVTETMTMRALRGVDSEKQAGPMPFSVSPVWPEGQNLKLLRPLLLQERDAIRTWLETKGFKWIDDPSNDNPSYERVRHRQKLKSDQTSKLQDTLLALQRRTSAMVPLIPALREIAKHTDPFGLITLPNRFPDDQMDSLLTLLIPAAAGHDRPPRATDRKSLIAALKAADHGQRFTLGSAWLERKSDHILIGREPGPSHADYQGALWDGRFEETTSPSLPEETAPFLVRHAIPPDRNWCCIIADRLNTEADVIEMNQVLLTKLHASDQS